MPPLPAGVASVAVRFVQCGRLRAGWWSLMTGRCGLLFVTIAGSGWYINYLGDQISTLKGNQIVLETQIQEQNESIERYLE